MKSKLSGLAFAAALLSSAAPSWRNPPIRIGEVNSYKAQAASSNLSRRGMELAVEEVNAAGGVGGRKIEVVMRDDNANPATRSAWPRNSSPPKRST